MNYTKKDLGSYNLHLIQTDKFKTITIRVVFHTPIKKEDITKRNILSDILLQSTKNYKTRRKLNIKSEELYAADIMTNNYRVGNYLFTSFSLRTLNDKYTEENNLEKSIEFFSDIIFNPDIKNNAFNEEKLDIVKSNTALQIASLKEDPNSYSYIRLCEAYDNNSPISYRMIGYIEDIEKINTTNLYETYQEMIDKDYVDIFVVGNFENKEMIELIKKYIHFKKIKKRKTGYIIEPKKIRRRILIGKEKSENTQSKLLLACPISNLTDYEKYYALTLGNIILGGCSDSKLFKEVREKNSLCYTISSRTNKLDNLLIISAGIDKKNFKKTLELVKKNLSDMKKGKFTQEEINQAKEIYNTSKDETYESESRIINEYFLRDILSLPSLEERATIINNITKQEIVKAMKKIKIDTVFLLEGVKNE